MPSLLSDRRRYVAPTFLFLVATAFASVLVQPFSTASIGRDAAAPVIHFERLLAGRHLEAYLGITPKPLITLINGVLYGTTRDWRAVAWAEIVAFALCVVLGAMLARRVAGHAAAAFVGVGLLLSPALLDELSFAHAVPWALLTWLVAGLAVTSDPPRFGLAGLALGIGALARLETLLIVVLATGAIVVAVAWSRRRDHPLPHRGVYLVLLGYLALPVMAIHDWLLSGDPFLWAKIAQINSDLPGATVQGPVWVAAWTAQHLLLMAPLLALAGLGALVVARWRAWALAIGLLALGPGVATFLVLLATRHVFFSPRYVEAIDLAMVFTAGLGLSAIDVPLLRDQLRWSGEAPRRKTAMLIAAGSIAAIACAPISLLDATVRRTVFTEIPLLRNEQRAVEVIRPALIGIPSWRDGGSDLLDGRPRVLVPARVREQLVVDLDLSLNAVVRTTAPGIDISRGRLAQGQIIYHDRLDDSDDPRYAVLEIEQPSTVGGVLLVPLLADRARGIWVIRVEHVTR